MSDAIPFSTVPHDHQDCIDNALDEAAELCTRRGVRLTPLRRRVLELIWDSHQATGAYAILDALSQENRRAVPPTVSRSTRPPSVQWLLGSAAMATSSPIRSRTAAVQSSSAGRGTVSTRAPVRAASSCQG